MPSQLAQLYQLVVRPDVGVAATGTSDFVLPFDDSAVDHLSTLDFGSKQAAIRALQVEELLNVTANRINSCLTLRERAQEIQVRVLTEAVEIYVQEMGTSLQTRIDEIVSPAANAAEAADLRTKRKELNDLLLLRPALLKSRAKEPGHGSNYGERYEFLRRMFQTVCEDAYVRAKVVQDALKAIYNIDHPVPRLEKDGFLDKLTFWTQTAADKLEIALEARRKVTVAISLGSPDGSTAAHVMNVTDFTNQRTAGVYSFDLKASFDRLKIKDPRIRSLCIQIIPKDNTHLGKYYPALLTPPAISLAPGDNSVPMIAMAGDVSSCWEFSTGDFHNVDPTVGDWTLRLQPQPVYGAVDAPDVLAHVVFHIVVSAVR